MPRGISNEPWRVGGSSGGGGEGFDPDTPVPYLTVTGNLVANAATFGTGNLTATGIATFGNLRVANLTATGNAAFSNLNASGTVVASNIWLVSNFNVGQAYTPVANVVQGATGQAAVTVTNSGDVSSYLNSDILAPTSAGRLRGSFYRQGGSSGFLTVPALATWQWWNEDFTMEWWFNEPSASFHFGYDFTIVGWGRGRLTPTSGTNAWDLQLGVHHGSSAGAQSSSGNRIIAASFFNGAAGGTMVRVGTSGSPAYEYNQWNHVAMTHRVINPSTVVGNSAAISIYVNGVLRATATRVAFNANYGLGSTFHAAAITQDSAYTGYATGVRLIRGNCFYTANFTPQFPYPTPSLPATANVAFDITPLVSEISEVRSAPGTGLVANLFTANVVAANAFTGATFTGSAFAGTTATVTNVLTFANAVVVGTGSRIDVQGGSTGGSVGLQYSNVLYAGSLAEKRTNGVTRFGIGTYNTNDTRVYSGGATSTSRVLLGYALSDTTFYDVLTVAREGSSVTTGNVGINVSAPAAPLHVVGNVRVDGSLAATGTVTQSSDLRLKSNLEVVGSALDKVGRLVGYTYDRVDMPGRRYAGLLAQDVHEVLPEAVSEATTGTLGVAYGAVTALFVEAIKELRYRVDELEQRVLAP